MSHLLSLDQEATCHIAQAADMCLMLTAGLDEAKGVTKHKGRVTDASWANVRYYLLSLFSPFPFLRLLY